MRVHAIGLFSFLSVGLFASRPAAALTPAQLAAIQFDVTDFDYMQTDIEAASDAHAAASDPSMDSVGEVIQVVIAGAMILADLSHYVRCNNLRNDIQDQQELIEDILDSQDLCSASSGRDVCEAAYAGLLSRCNAALDDLIDNYSAAGCYKYGPY